MADENTPVGPQDTVIFLLGELKGHVDSLNRSVTTSVQSQSEVNAANEAEHATFRREIAKHETALAILDNAKQQYQEASLRAAQADVDAAKDRVRAQQDRKLTRMQTIALWVGAPSGILAVGGGIVWIATHFH
jgi:hypothetical protein